MSTMVTVEWPTKSGTLPDFLDVLKQLLPDTRTYEGCENVQTFVEESTGSVLLIEFWATEELQQEYLEWRMETGMMDVVGGYLKSPPVVRTFSIKKDV